LRCNNFHALSKDDPFYPLLDKYLKICGYKAGVKDKDRDKINGKIETVNPEFSAYAGKVDKFIKLAQAKGFKLNFIDIDSQGLSIFVRIAGSFTRVQNLNQLLDNYENTQNNQKKLAVQILKSIKRLNKLNRLSEEAFQLRDQQI
ncbi:MAG: hypothetical protein ACKO96_21055, partial [Flammeovirgaceae bacterium]